MTFPHVRRPCSECPWRRDVAPGQFPPERFVTLAPTAYDMSPMAFACHKSADDEPFACAGFLLVGAVHNFTVRMAVAHGELDPGSVTSDHPLYESYRAMAEANGVTSDHLALAPCR